MMAVTESWHSLIIQVDDNMTVATKQILLHVLPEAITPTSAEKAATKTASMHALSLVH